MHHGKLSSNGVDGSDRRSEEYIVREPLGRRPTLLVIVPFRAHSSDDVRRLAAAYIRFAREEGDWLCRIVIADNSAPELSGLLNGLLERSPIVHLHVDATANRNINLKMRNVQCALKDERADCICLLDDDIIPEMEAVQTLASSAARTGVARSMIRYESPSTWDRIDLAGIFVINAVSRDRQFWGNIAFRGGIISYEAFEEHPYLLSTVFDELTLERYATGAGAKLSYCATYPLLMTPSRRTAATFWEQRVRYAYENLALPGRTAVFLALMPALIIACRFGGPALMAATLVALLGGSAGAAYAGRVFAGHPSDRLSWMLAPVWMSPYLVTTWIAVILYIRGGLKWGSQIIRRPA